MAFDLAQFGSKLMRLRNEQQPELAQLVQFWNIERPPAGF